MNSRNLSALVLAVASITPAPLHAGFVFTRIADTNTPVPGGAGNFVEFKPPSIDGGTVAFKAYGNNQEGVYVTSGGGLGIVADRNTAVPGTKGKFESFANDVSVSGNRVAFVGAGGGQSGIYIGPAKPNLTQVASTRTNVPGTDKPFQTFSGPSYKGNTAFAGGGAGVTGVFYTQAGVQALATDKTPVPGGKGTFTSFDSVAISQRNIAFIGHGANNSSGVYSNLNGLNAVADQNTPVPGGKGNFLGFTSAAISGKMIVFSAYSLMNIGVYAAVDKMLKVIADANTAVPGGKGAFQFLGRVSVSGNNVVFGGADAAFNPGIYASINGTLSKVISAGDKLDGKTVSNLDLGPASISGVTITFKAEFTDGSQGIYNATAGRNAGPNQATPEPATLTLGFVGLTALLAGAFRRRRRPL